MRCCPCLPENHDGCAHGDDTRPDLYRTDVWFRHGSQWFPTCRIYADSARLAMSQARSQSEVSGDRKAMVWSPADGDGWRYPIARFER